MKNNRESKEDTPRELEDLRNRLEEAEETLSAIRRGEIDGLLVTGAMGDQVFTLKGTDSAYRFFVESMNEGAVTLTHRGTILYCNERFAELMGIASRNITGKSIYQFVSSQALFESVFARGKNERSRTEILLTKANDEQVPVSVSFNPMQESEVPGICMVVSDLTEQKRQQEMLKQKAAQLTRLSSELTLSEQRERRRLAEFLHDRLQQFLIAIKINVEILAANAGRNQEQIIGNIQDLISQTIESSRTLTAELSPPVLKQGSLSAALEWLARWVHENHHLAVELQIDPEVDTAEESVTFFIFEAVRELLLNVVKHAGTQSALVRMGREGRDSLRVTVRDEGSGFDPEAVREDVSDVGGLGLFSIRERLALWGGNFEIKSSPGMGASFTLVVPLKKMEELNANDIKKGMSGIPGARMPKEKIRVLLVDDHTMVREGLATMLNFHSDIEVVGEAADGEEASQKARELHPDVILMDISMPKMNGIEATRIISSEFPHIHIIGLSMHESHEQADQMIAAGASAYCTKDGDSNILLSQIRSA